MTALLVVVVDVDPEHEVECNRWYDEEHIPEKTRHAGLPIGPSSASHDRPGRYLAVYEIEDGDVVTSAEYLSPGGR